MIETSRDSEKNKLRLEKVLDELLHKIKLSGLSDPDYIDERIDKITEANKKIDEIIKNKKYGSPLKGVIWAPVAFGVGSVLLGAGAVLMLAGSIAMALGTIPVTLVALYKGLQKNKETYLFIKKNNLKAIDYLEKMKKQSKKESYLDDLENEEPFNEIYSTDAETEVEIYTSKLGIGSIKDPAKFSKLIDDKIKIIEDANKEINTKIKNNDYSKSWLTAMLKQAAYAGVIGGLLGGGAALIGGAAAAPIFPALGFGAAMIASSNPITGTKEEYLQIKKENTKAIAALKKIKSKRLKQLRSVKESDDMSILGKEELDPFLDSGEKYIDSYKSKNFLDSENLDDRLILKPSNDIPTNDYAYQSMWKEHLVREMEYQNEMNAYISECCAIAEGIDPFSKMVAISEGVGEKAKDIWSKVVTFVKRIFAKFVERLTSWFTTNTWYLDKYKEIILTKPLKALDSVEMPNHSLGTKRILTRVVPAFNVAEIEKVEVSGDKDHDTMVYINRNLGIEEFKGDMQTGEFFTSYFKGGEDTTIQAGSLDLADMYEFCRDFKKIKSALDKDQSTILKAQDAANKEIDNLQSKLKNKEDIVGQAQEKDAANDAAKAKAAAQAAAPKTTSVPTAAAAEPGKGGGQLKVTGSRAAVDAHANDNNIVKKQESAKIYSNIYNTYLTEEDLINEDVTINKSDASSSKDGGAAGKVSSTAGGANTYAKNIGHGTGISKNSNTDVATMVKNGQGEIADKDNPEETEKEITKKINLYFNTSSSMVASKLSAIESIRQDYMKIITAHVQFYVGDEGKAPTQGQARNQNNYKAEKKVGGKTQAEADKEEADRRNREQQANNASTGNER